MTVFAVTYAYIDDADVVTQHRPAHREYLGSLIGTAGLIASGPTKGGTGASALLIFEATAASDIEALLDQDPFWTEGVVVRREILEWTVALGTVGESSGH